MGFESGTVLGVALGGSSGGDPFRAAAMEMAEEVAPTPLSSQTSSANRPLRIRKVVP